MSAPPTVVEVPLRWSDLDAYGHVNNATFVTLLEEARIRVLNAWFGGLEVLDRGVLVAEHHIDYLAQLSYVPAVAAHIWCTDIGASTFRMAYEVRDRDGQGEVRYAVAETTLVSYDVGAGRLRRLSAEERAVLEGVLGDAPERRRRGVRG